MDTDPAKVKPHHSVVAGLLMGSADAVPGVSGGTIALIVGIYERFITALSTMVALPALIRKPEGRKRLAGALKLLLPLGVGIVIGYYLVTRLLVGKEDNPGILLVSETAPICYGFLFGLVLASIPEPLRRIERFHWGQVIAFIAGAALAAWFVGLPHTQGTPATWMLLLGGAGAISVMLLPGVSGSLLLVIIGQYQAVAGAVHDRQFDVLGVFAAGLVLGIITFIPLLKLLLAKFHGITMAALGGLMAGSLRALWPYKNTYDAKAGELSNIWSTYRIHWVILALLAGAAVVLLLRMFERALEKGSAG